MPIWRAVGSSPPPAGALVGSGLNSPREVLHVSMPSQRQPGFRLLTVCGSLQARSANRAAIAVASAVAAERAPPSTTTTAWPTSRRSTLTARRADRGGRGLAAPGRRRRCRARGRSGVRRRCGWSGQERVRLAGRLRQHVSQAGWRDRRWHLRWWHARQAVAQTLTWQGAYVVAELGVAAPRTKSDEEGSLTDGRHRDGHRRVDRAPARRHDHAGDRPGRCCRPGRRLARHRLLARVVACYVSAGARRGVLPSG